LIFEQNSVHLYSFFPIPHSPFPISMSDSAIKSDYYICFYHPQMPAFATIT